MSASKRDELVQKSLRSFYRGGFHAIGMDRLAKETGVSKTAMYKHFRTKEDLILATLRLRDEQFRNWMVRRVEASAETPKEKLMACFDVLGEWFTEPEFQSCFFIKASSEYHDRNHPIHAAAAEHKRLLQIYLKGLAEEACAADAEGLSRQLLVIMEGAIVLAHLLEPVSVTADARAAGVMLIEQSIK